MEIRRATENDKQALLDIYNYEVLHGVATFDIGERTKEEWDDWFQAHHTLFVAEEEGKIIGFVGYSRYRTRAAYDATVETTLYIHHEHRKQGVATKLMEYLIAYAKECPDVHVLVAVITSVNDASNQLHEKLGFSFCGTMPEVGYKNGQFLGISNWVLLV